MGKGRAEDTPQGEPRVQAAEAMKDRMEDLQLTQMDLAARAHVSLATVRELLHGTPRRRNRRTLAAISEALQWPADHLSSIIRGVATDKALPAGDDAVDTADARHSAAYEAIMAELKSMHDDLQRVDDRLARVERFVLENRPQQR